MKRIILKSIVATLVFAVPVCSFAQNNGQNGPGGFQGQGQGGFGQGGFGQGGQQPNPQQIQDGINRFRQTQIDQMREELGITDDAEWNVVLPKIQKVQTLQESSGGGMTGLLGSFGRGGLRGRGGGGQGFNIAQLLNPNGQVSPYQRKLQELQDALANKEMPESEVKARLAAVRVERDRVRTELAAARADLIQVLTPRQEAALFSRGILE